MASKRVREKITHANWQALECMWPICDWEMIHDWTVTERLDELIRRQDETDEAMADITAGMTDRQLRRRYGAMFERLGLK